MRNLLTLLLLFLSPLLHAQQKNLTFYHFGVNEGLSQGNVTCMMRDHLGLMWFGTIEGLNVWDGYKNTVYREAIKKKTGLKGDRIINILEINSNEIAIGTYAGLNIFYRDRDSFAYFTSKNASQLADIISIENGCILLFQNDLLTSFDLKKKIFSKIETPFSKQINEIVQKSKSGKHHSQYLTMRLYTILKKRPNDFERIKALFIANEINDIEFDNEGQKFHLATSLGYLSYDISTATYSKKILTGSMKCLSLQGNNLFIGSKDSGFFVYNIKFNKFTAHYLATENRNESILGNYVRTFFVDGQSNLWISVLGNGISYCKLKPTIAQTMLSQSNKPLLFKTRPYIQAMTEDNANHLWLVDVSGTITVLDTAYKLVKSFVSKDIDPVEKPFSIQQIYTNAKNEIYLLTEKGLYYSLDHIHFIRVKNSNNTTNNRRMFYLRNINDTLNFLSTDAGIFRFSELTKMIYEKDTINKKLSSRNYIYADQQGSIYAYSKKNEIGIFGYDGNKMVQSKTIQLNVHIFHACEQKDTIYFATTKGILVLDKHSLKYVLLDIENGLTSDNIFVILADPIEKNSFWFSSNKGIFKYNTITKESFALGINDGLSTVEFLPNSFAKRKNGDFVFGSIDGITYFNPTKIEKDTNRNDIVCYNLKFNNRFPASLHITRNDNQFTIPYQYNSLSFRLMQVNFPTSECQIRYKLIGLEKEWNTENNPIDIRYPNLREGRYTFVAQYYNRNIGWVEKRFFGIVIKAPWYRSFWAFLIYIIFTVAVLFVIANLYVKRKMQEKNEEQRAHNLLIRERDRISADFHDDIGSTLSSVSIYNELIQTHINNKPEIIKNLSQKMAIQIKELMMRTEDIIWSLQIGNHKNETIAKRVHEYVVELLQTQNIEARINIEDNAERLIHHPEHRRTILMIVKEAMNNCRKYSDAGYFQLSIKIQNEQLNIAISDNGIGFDASTIQYGDGITNIKGRCKNLKGTCTIKSEPAKGTQIYCSIPIASISYSN